MAIWEPLGTGTELVQQNTQKYMDEKGINAFGFPQSQDAVTPPPMVDDGQGMVPMPDQGATPVNPPMISGGSGMAGGSGVVDGSFDFPTTPMQAGGSGLSALTSGQIGNIPIEPFMRNDVPPLLNANVEGLPALGQQYQSGEITTPGLLEGTSGQLGVQISKGRFFS